MSVVHPPRQLEASGPEAPHRRHIPCASHNHPERKNDAAPTGLHEAMLRPDSSKCSEGRLLALPCFRHPVYCRCKVLLNHSCSLRTDLPHDRGHATPATLLLQRFAVFEGHSTSHRDEITLVLDSNRFEMQDQRK